MFEELERWGTPIKKLKFQTRAGGSVELVVTEGKPTAGQVMKFKDLAAAFHWREQRQPTLGYNCAGHVWASRRGEICEDPTIERILQEDGYRKVNTFDEVPRVGDICVYSALEDKFVFLHVGMVVSVFDDRTKTGELLLLSKMDGCSGEYIHKPENVPFEKKSGIKFRLDYYTDRPVGEPPCILF